MTCPKLKIPWPRWAIGDKPNAEQEHENYLALERWADGILKCIPAAAGDIACIAHADALGGTVGSEVYEGNFSIIAESGDFSAPSAGNITVPEAGIYAFNLFLYWYTYPSITGTDGMSYGVWYTEVDTAGSYVQHISSTPFIKDGSAPSALRYFSTGGLVVAQTANSNINILAGPQFFLSGASGDSFWDLSVGLVKVSSLVEPPPAS